MSTAHRYLQTVRWLIREADPGKPRTIALAVALGFWPTLQLAVRSGRALDHLVAPEFRRQNVPDPVFIVGHPRSGTTYLHRLLATDTDHFTALQSWQLMLPSLSLQRAARWVLSQEGPEGPLHRFAHRTERVAFDVVASRHRTSWRSAEEDGLLLMHKFGATHIEMLAALPDRLGEVWFPDQLPAAEQRRWMRWYRGSWMRQLVDTSPGLRPLCKSPNFTGWMRGLHEAFPNARFIMLVRRPEDAIASFVHLQAQVWRVLRADLRPGAPEYRTLVERSVKLYQYAESTWDELPPSQRLRVRYDHLVAEPVATVERIYKALGWPMTPQTRRTIEARATRHMPSAVPPLRTYGIRHSELKNLLGELRQVHRKPSV